MPTSLVNRKTVSSLSRRDKPIDKPIDKPVVCIPLCHFGMPCRYHRKTTVRGVSIYKKNKISALRELYHVVPICPEQLGGLPTPREPCNVVLANEKLSVIGRNTGKDYTAEYRAGAQAALELMNIYNSKVYYSVTNSPMCGQGYGILARLLESLEGYEVRKL